MIQTRIQQVSSMRLPATLLKVLAGLTACLAIIYLLLFFALALVRLVYPYELEWIEGAYVDEVYRIAQGYFPFSPPNIHLIPLSKTPAFFYLSALLVKIFGGGFILPRLVSILASAGIFVLLFTAIHEGSRSWLPGIVAAGIYAATFRLSGAWMDLAKTDSLFLFLMLAALVASLRARDWPGYLLGGVLFVLAYFTKQLALPVILAVAVTSMALRRGRSWPQWLITLVLGTALFLAFEWASKGWFSFYTLDTGTSHNRIADIGLFWSRFLPAMWPAVILSGYFGFKALRRSNFRTWVFPEKDWEYLAFAAALVMASWAIFLKMWTYDNALMMASLGAALLAGLGLRDAYADSFEKKPASGTSLVLALSLLLAILQFGILFYNPLQQLPTKEDRAAGANFLNLLRDLDGEVLVFNHGFYSHLAGKPIYLHSAPYSDVTDANIRKPDKDTLHRQQAVIGMFSGAISGQYFDWIILDDPQTSWTPYYLFAEDISPQSGAFFPVTGMPARPASLTVRNPVARGGELPLTDEKYDFLFTENWTAAQAGSRGLNGDRAKIDIFLERNAYDLRLTFEPACHENQPAARYLRIGWNNAVLGEVMLTSCNSQTVLYDLPKQIIRKNANSLWFASETGAGQAGPGPASIQFRSIAFVRK